MAERKTKNDPGNYAADIWGTQLEQKQPSRRKPKGKYGTISIGGNTFTQDALFQGEEIRIPFPDAPVNRVPDRIGTTDPGTLFARPEPEPLSTQPALFTAQQEAATAQTDQPTRRQSPTNETTPTSQEKILHAPDI